jgi:ribosomal protein L23
MSNNILIKPIISEKSEKLTGKGNQYTFVVDKKANKLEIKKAVEVNVYDKRCSSKYCSNCLLN